MLNRPPHLFDAAGQLLLDRVRHCVAEPLACRSMMALTPDKILAAVREVGTLTEGRSNDKVSRRLAELEAVLLPSHDLVASGIPINRHGDRGREFVYFTDRRDLYSCGYADIEKMHASASLRVTSDILGLIGEQPGEESVETHVFVRLKTVASIERKMKSKGLDRWEVGDILGLFVCPRTLGAVASIARMLEGTYGSDILYKQNGFADSVIDGQRADRAVARRVFHIIRYDAAVCFELQLVTLRQLLYIHLSHPGYVGASYGVTAKKALHDFGDRAYLLDLEDIIDDTGV